MADKKTYKRVLLAYSGGLDTSIIIPWLKENYGCAVVCCAADVGQGEELAPLHEKAKKTGAESFILKICARSLSRTSSGRRSRLSPSMMASICWHVLRPSADCQASG